MEEACLVQMAVKQVFGTPQQELIQQMVNHTLNWNQVYSHGTRDGVGVNFVGDMEKFISG